MADQSHKLDQHSAPRGQPGTARQQGHARQGRLPEAARRPAAEPGPDEPEHDPTQCDGPDDAVLDPRAAHEPLDSQDAAAANDYDSQAVVADRQDRHLHETRRRDRPPASSSKVDFSADGPIAHDRRRRPASRPRRHARSDEPSRSQPRAGPARRSRPAPRARARPRRRPRSARAAARRSPTSLAAQTGARPVLAATRSQRLERRGIDLGDGTLAPPRGGGVDRAAGKGSRESVVFVDGTAFVVSVRNRTVITAVDREHMREHVFTNIDTRSSRDAGARHRPDLARGGQSERK